MCGDDRVGHGLAGLSHEVNACVRGPRHRRQAGGLPFAIHDKLDDDDDDKQTNKWERGKDSSLSSEKDVSGGGGGGVKAITIDCCWSACLRTKSSVVPKVPHPLGAPLKFGEMAANHRRTRRCR